MKVADTPFQLPGCNRENSNGVSLPYYIEHPIKPAKLNEIPLIGWDQVVYTMKHAATRHARAGGNHQDDNDMTAVTCQTRDDE